MSQYVKLFDAGGPRVGIPAFIARRLAEESSAEYHGIPEGQAGQVINYWRISGYYCWPGEKRLGQACLTNRDFMCGIYGIFSFNDPLRADTCLDALDMIRHRGPDGYGFEFGDWRNKQHTVSHNNIPDTFQASQFNYFVGHRRLSIIDLNENAFQPMVSTCQRYSITFNGEIYNYIELRQELEQAGHRFLTDHSDTEVLLNAYIQWGTDCLQHLRGMFAFAILDRQRNLIFAARDRIGQKTLYYEMSEQGFSFASEIDPIARTGASRSIDIEALNLYLQIGYVPHPHSIFEGIKKLPPASYALVDLARHQVSITEYWDVGSNQDCSLAYEDATKRTRTALQDAVAYRLRADVSFGAFISGGTDSTLIVKYISEHSTHRVDIYGADFPNTTRSERKYIEAAAKRYDQNLILSEIDTEHIANIQSIIDVFDEPFDGASSIAVFELFRMASGQHKIIVTGDGGDEMFAGYTRYVSFPRRERVLDAIRTLKLPALLLSAANRIGILPGKLQNFLRLLQGDLVGNFTGLNSNREFQRLLRPEYRAAPDVVFRTFAALGNKLREKSLKGVKALQYLELKTILPGRMLYKIDRFSMHYGVEARSPFLDHKLAELAYSIPDRINMSNGVPKAILKTLLSEDFRSDFVHRDKQGFGSPLTNWFKNGDTNQILRLLREPGSVIFRFLDFRKTQAILDTLLRSDEEHHKKGLWRLVVLGHYFDSYERHIRIPE